MLKYGWVVNIKAQSNILNPMIGHNILIKQCIIYNLFTATTYTKFYSKRPLAFSKGNKLSNPILNGKYIQLLASTKTIVCHQVKWIKIANYLQITKIMKHHDH